MDTVKQPSAGCPSSLTRLAGLVTDFVKNLEVLQFVVGLMNMSVYLPKVSWQGCGARRKEMNREVMCNGIFPL